MKKHWTFCYFGSGGLDLPVMGQAVTRYRQQGGGLTVIARTATQLFDDARVRAFVEEAMKTDAVFIHIHGGKGPAFDPVVEEIAARRAHGKKTPSYA